MKQLLEEARDISVWCSICPHSDINNPPEKQEEQYNKRSSFFVTPHPGLYKCIMESKILDEFKFQEKIETIPLSEEEQEWHDWVDNFEHFRNCDTDNDIFCPYIKKKGLNINLDRDFVIPEDDIEFLRMLDRLSGCYFEECKYNRYKPYHDISVEGKMCRALAKIDFSLIERGKDFGRIMYDMYFPYYDRKKDIGECGFSMELIKHYLKKHNIILKSNDEYLAEDHSKDHQDQDNNRHKKQEFIDAVQNQKCDEQGILLIKKAEFTRYLSEHYSIKSGYQKYWIRFDRIFCEQNGTPISYKTFQQSYKDQVLRGTYE